MLTEGTSVTYTLATTNVANGTLVPYTISGISSADISGASLTGNFTVSNGSATLTLTIANDATTEGSETMTNTAQGQSSAITINDTSVNLVPTGFFRLEYGLESRQPSAWITLQSSHFNTQGYYVGPSPSIYRSWGGDGGGGGYWIVHNLRWDGTRYLTDVENGGGNDLYQDTSIGSRPANKPTGSYYPWEAVWIPVNVNGWGDYIPPFTKI